MASAIRTDHPPRAVIHAGPLVLAGHTALQSLERYLDEVAPRELYLVHRGQPRLRDMARETGVTDIAIEDPADTTGDAYAAEMALAVSAEELEFAIDEPALSTVTGSRIREMTVGEAERLADRGEFSSRLCAKLWAGCLALRRGLARVRIGSPNALRRGRATVIVPDPALDVSAALGEPRDLRDGAPPPREGTNEIDLPSTASEQPPLRLARRPSRVARYTPNRGCQIGPRSASAFPDFPYPDPLERAPEARSRSVRRVRRAS